MDPATISAWIALIAEVVSLMIQAGNTIVDMAPYVAMFIQVVTGTPLTPEQQTQLKSKHAELTDAALAPLPDAPEDAT